MVNDNSNKQYMDQLKPQFTKEDFSVFGIIGGMVDKLREHNFISVQPVPTSTEPADPKEYIKVYKDLNDALVWASHITENLKGRFEPHICDYFEACYETLAYGQMGLVKFADQVNAYELYMLRNEIQKSINNIVKGFDLLDLVHLNPKYVEHVLEEKEYIKNRIAQYEAYKAEHSTCGRIKRACSSLFKFN